MCGRFALSLDPEEINSRLKDMQLHVQSWVNEDQYRPNFNLAPQNRAAVVRRKESRQTELVIDCMKWGLIPHWTESPPAYGTLLNTINARDDKVVEPRGLWNSIKGRKRCIVLCEGFFEWLTKGKEKIPHFTKRAGGQLMCLAGLWDSVTYKGTQEELHTFTIITTSSNKYLSFLHDRMPVILPDRLSMESWLDTASLEWSPHLSKLLKPFGEPEGLVCYPVPKEVGKVGTQSPDFLQPVSQRKGNIMSFFKKEALKGPQSSGLINSSSSSSKREKIVKEESKGSDQHISEECKKSLDFEHEPKPSTSLISSSDSTSIKRPTDLIDSEAGSSPKKIKKVS